MVQRVLVFVRKKMLHINCAGALSHRLTSEVILPHTMNEISENQTDLNSSLLPVGVDLTAIGVHIF